MMNAKASKCTFKAKVDTTNWILPMKMDIANGARKLILLQKITIKRLEMNMMKTLLYLVKVSTIRAFLATSSYKRMRVMHIDTKVFLHENLNKEIYMQQLEDYAKPSNKNIVCKLKNWRKRMNSNKVEQILVSCRRRKIMKTL